MTSTHSALDEGIELSMGFPDQIPVKFQLLQAVLAQVQVQLPALRIRGPLVLGFGEVHDSPVEIRRQLGGVGIVHHVVEIADVGKWKNGLARISANYKSVIRQGKALDPGLVGSVRGKSVSAGQCLDSFVCQYDSGVRLNLPDPVNIGLYGDVIAGENIVEKTCACKDI